MKKFNYLGMMPIYILVFCCCIAAAWIGNYAVTAISVEKMQNERSTIIIDPGHGGVDGGTTSCSGVPESGINLDIALRLDDLLHLLGYRTVMTRRTDMSIHSQGDTIAQKKVSDLKQRVNIVNSAHNGMLISIHQNYYGDGKYSGAQVFYAATDGSQHLAENLQSAMVNTLNTGSKRSAKKASGIYLMEHVNCTGILVECGFLSNPHEDALLRSADYQKKLCCVIAGSASMYLDHNKKN